MTIVADRSSWPRLVMPSSREALPWVIRPVAPARNKKTESKTDSVPGVGTAEGDFDSSLPNADSSDSSDDSDGESVVSTASSATTVNGDMVGSLFAKLLHFRDLR